MKLTEVFGIVLNKLCTSTSRVSMGKIFRSDNAAKTCHYMSLEFTFSQAECTFYYERQISDFVRKYSYLLIALIQYYLIIILAN